jgi:ABC-type nitrate/sulfonate/bicarbonate transport system permease component
MNETTVAGDRARRLPPWAGPWVRGTTGGVAFLVLAEAAGRLGIVSRSALPLTSSVLARVVLLGILGYLLNALLGGAGRLVLSWHTDKGQD